MATQSGIEAKSSHGQGISKSANSLPESLVFAADRYSLLYIFRDMFFANFENYTMRKWSVKLSLQWNFGFSRKNMNHWFLNYQSEVTKKSISLRLFRKASKDNFTASAVISWWQIGIFALTSLFLVDVEAVNTVQLLRLLAIWLLQELWVVTTQNSRVCNSDTLVTLSEWRNGERSFFFREVESGL